MWLPDLHIHTTASDGSLTPSQVVRKAAERGLNIISITDHDTLSGLEQH
ncbi:MAG: PHP domain-containing protein, partial [Clostridiales bacterium]|nr:PHP domain-containing protein [Clostridiales bacterium]